MNPQEVDSRYFVEYRLWPGMELMASYSLAQPPIVPRPHETAIVSASWLHDTKLPCDVYGILHLPPNKLVVLVTVNELAPIPKKYAARACKV